jgi:hypothetical protein
MLLEHVGDGAAEEVLGGVMETDVAEVAQTSAVAFLAPVQTIAVTMEFSGLILNVQKHNLAIVT